MRRFLLIPHIKIHNANAMSSPYTIGFPAMTAWLGAVHALQRYVQQQGFSDARFLKVGVSCHAFDLQTYKGRGDFVSSIIGTSNPLDKDGNRPAFIEEARCHLTVSLLIEYEGIRKVKLNEFIALLNQSLPRFKMASGDILSVKPIEDLYLNEDESSELRKISNKLMLGHVLIERRDLMIKSMNSGKDALDALLDHLKLMHRAKQDADGNVTWTTERLEKGWLVPIAVGFQGISDLAIAQNQRDSTIPHRFAESVITLGEFVMPYRLSDIDQMLWQYHVDQSQNLYLCQTNTQTA
ncbi:MAG TPA: type I-F CRISPR-associated protein Csy2 [Agitococcus sp.]|nr:type I-F CRISPR-associated protein Csy2 [Agitococcus sp.]HNC02838.1 type I-F CRISPR-associated protein Csy2 [Agitococcus sp.]